MISLEEARTRILARCPRLAPLPLPLAEALGCVTAEGVFSDEAVPGFVNSAMDGYALHAADTAGVPVRLRVVATLAAGADPSGVVVGPGEAARIMTGAALPKGADAVVMVERTIPDHGGSAVVVETAVRTGENVRQPGEDVAPGQEVFPAGTVLGPGHLGVLASIGTTTVEVFPPAQVGVASTGDELVDGSGPLRPGQIRDSNRPALLALIRQAGWVGVDLGGIGDTEDDVADALRFRAEGCDAVLTTGGVSMGDYDVVKGVLGTLGGSGGGATMRVAIKPAKPLSFGVVGGRPVFGLPGNPVSAMVSFELFARPALRAMTGHTDLDRPRVVAVADEALSRRRDGKIHFVRVVARWESDGRAHVRRSGGQGSHQLRAMALANALAVVPDGDGVPSGGDVEVLLLT